MAAHFSLISEKARACASAAPGAQRSAHGADLCAAARRCISQTCRQRAESERSPLRRRRRRGRERAATQRRVSSQQQWARAPAAHAAQGAAAAARRRRALLASPAGTLARGRARARCRRVRARPQLNHSGYGKRAWAGNAARAAAAVLSTRAWLPDLAQVPLQRRVRALRSGAAYRRQLRQRVSVRKHRRTHRRVLNRQQDDARLGCHG